MTTYKIASRTIRWLGAGVVGAGLMLATVLPATAAAPVQRVTSPGGLEAWLIESHDIGIISMRVLFDGGLLAEPADKPGVGQFASYLFNEGAGPLDTDALSRKRQRIGVSFGGSIDATGLTISFSAPTIHKQEAFALLRQAFHAPRYDDDAIERARREYEAALAAESQAPGSVAVAKLRSRFFAGTRLAVSTYGTPESVKQITAADIKAFRERTFARGNMKIAVAGDITPAELGPVLDDLLGGLRATAELPAKPPVGPQQASAEVAPMQLPQAVVLTGNVAPRLTWRQSMAFDIGNQVLGGDSTSRLFQEVREKRGLVYGIQAGRSDVAAHSLFITSFGAGSDNVGQALAETRRQIDAFLANGPTAEEMESAKSAFLGNFFLSLDTNDKLVGQVLWMLREGLPISYLDDYAGEIARITVDDVRAAAKAAIRPEIMSTVLVGNAPADLKLDDGKTASAAQ